MPFANGMCFVAVVEEIVCQRRFVKWQLQNEKVRATNIHSQMTAAEMEDNAIPHMNRWAGSSYRFCYESGIVLLA